MTLKYSRQKLKEIAYQRQLIEDLETLANECPMGWANEVYKLKIHEAKLLYRELHPNHLEFKSEKELRDAIDASRWETYFDEYEYNQGEH